MPPTVAGPATAVRISHCRVLWNGDLLCDFDDGVRCLMAPSCVEYAIIRSEEEDQLTKHYLPFAPKIHLPYVLECVQFFNTYCMDEPVMCDSLVSRLPVNDIPAVRVPAEQNSHLLASFCVVIATIATPLFDFNHSLNAGGGAGLANRQVACACRWDGG